VEDGHVLNSHEDVPLEIQEQLYAEEQQRHERQQKAAKPLAAQSSSPPININVLPAQSPEPRVFATPAATPPLLPHTSPSLLDDLTFPDLPLDVAVKEYSDWQQSRVESEMQKGMVEKARDLALAMGWDLRQIYKDQNPKLFTNHGVIDGVARRFVEDICDWMKKFD
jgi:hypothetical protein